MPLVGQLWVALPTPGILPIHLPTPAPRRPNGQQPNAVKVIGLQAQMKGQVTNRPVLQQTRVLLSTLSSWVPVIEGLLRLSARQSNWGRGLSFLGKTSKSGRRCTRASWRVLYLTRHCWPEVLLGQVGIRETIIIIMSISKGVQTMPPSHRDTKTLRRLGTAILRPAPPQCLVLTKLAWRMIPLP